MSFWETSAGAKATGDVTENNMDPLPKGWQTAMLEEASVNDYQGKRTVKFKIRVVSGPYNNRVVFAALKVFEFEGNKDTARDNALQKLVKMYQVTGAKLPDSEPDDRSLSQLIDKPLDVMFDVWEMDGKSGNWIVNIAAKGEKAGPPAPSKNNAIGGKTAASKLAVPAAFDENEPPF